MDIVPVQGSVELGFFVTVENDGLLGIGNTKIKLSQTIQQF